MIPEILEILKMAKAGQCTIEQAMSWMVLHMERVENSDLRDHFAAQVLPAYFSNGEDHGSFGPASLWAYQMADAMLKARQS